MSDLFGDDGDKVKPIRKPRSKVLGTEAEAQLVWEAWRKYQRRPEICRFTQDRAKLIRERLGLGYQAEDLIAVVRWANECQERMPRFLRGENDRRTAYLDLESLFRECHLGGRVEAARNWIEDEKGPAPDQVTHPSGLTLILGRRVRR